MRGARGLLILAGAMMLSGCGGPLSTLDPAGPIAAQIAWLWWAMLAGAALITLFVLGLLAMGFGQPRTVNTRTWTHGLGLWFSLTILTILLGGGLWVGERILPRDDGAIEVQAEAFQWGWQFVHPGPDGTDVTSDGVLHIPVGVPVDVLITSTDVIHSFWVPQMAGKVDAIPGRVNRARILADRPGRYDGLCAEFCGLGHAGMRFVVVAHTEWPPVLTEDEDAP